MREKLIDELVMFFQGYGINSNDIKDRLYMIMSDYEILERETALSVLNEDKNEMYMKRFIVAKTVRGCSRRTLEEYQNTIRKVLENIGKTVDEITPDDVRLYLAVRQKRDGISKSYANTERRYLSTFFGFLFQEELIPHNPIARIEQIKVDKKTKKAFDELEIEKMRNSCKTAREKCIVEMLLSTGCRVSELVKMKISDVDSDKIVVHGKGGKDRTVYLNAKALVALENYLKERKDSNPYIFSGGYFSNPKKGNPSMWYTNPESVTTDTHTDTGTIEAVIRRIGKNACVKNAHPHRFRRTCATIALRHGMPLMIVSKMLGHESVATTQIYLDLNEDEVAQAHKKYVAI